MTEEAVAPMDVAPELHDAVSPAAGERSRPASATNATPASTPNAAGTADVTDAAEAVSRE